MTDEERQELAIHLRQMSHSLDVYSPDALRRAADEIERLSALAQSDAEPVAWDRVRRVLEAARICFKSRDHDPVEMKVLAAIEIMLAAKPFPQPQRNDGGKPCGECHLQPGETCDVCGAKAQSDAEPRPDASAGLIEAARYLEKAKYGGGTPWQLGIRHGLEIAAKHLRARAADRSGK